MCTKWYLLFAAVHMISYAVERIVRNAKKESSELKIWEKNNYKFTQLSSDMDVGHMFFQIHIQNSEKRDLKMWFTLTLQQYRQTCISVDRCLDRCSR